MGEVNCNNRMRQDRIGDLRLFFVECGRFL